MQKHRTFGIVLMLFAILLAGYFFYDSYFQLPFDNPPATEENSPEEEAPKEPEFGRFNILIIGVDGRAGVNDRADTIILASLDEEKNQGQLLSIPRDTRVKIKGAWDKINAAYAYGGVELTKETITDFLGVRIDRYVVVDFNSLIKIVDEIGGIEVDVPVRMYVPLEGIDLQPGRQHLNGEQVLAYSRFRGTPEGDIGRAKRQQEVITLLAEEIIKPQNLTRIPQLIPIIREDVKTDLSVKEMISLARIAPDTMKKGLITRVLPGENKKIDGLWYWEPDISSLEDLLAIPLTPSANLS